MKVLILKFNRPTGDLEDSKALDELMNMQDLDISAHYDDAETGENAMITHSINYTVCVPEHLWYGKLEMKYDYWEDDSFEWKSSWNDYLSLYEQQTLHARRVWQAWREVGRVLLDCQKQKPKTPWHDANGDYLPAIDREVIVMCQDFEDDTEHLRVSIAHRPDPAGWDGRSVTTGKVTHYDVKTYGKGGWNQDKVKYWLDVPLPNEGGLTR